MNSQVTTDQLIGYMNTSIVHAIQTDKAGVISLLRSNGIDVNDTMSDDFIQLAVLKVLKDNPIFRKNLGNYLAEQTVKGNSSPFSNATGSEDVPSASQKKAYEDTLLGSIFNKDRIGNIFDSGLNILSNNLNAKANKDGEQAAYQKALADTEKLKAQRDATLAAQSSHKWVVPVVIIGLIVVAGATGFYFYSKSLKKKA